MVNVGIIDVDGKMPNLALMKLSNYHKQIGDNVELYSNENMYNYDKIYISSILTKNKEEYVRLYELLSAYADVGMGGTGHDIKKNFTR